MCGTMMCTMYDKWSMWWARVPCVPGCVYHVCLAGVPCVAGWCTMCGKLVCAVCVKLACTMCSKLVCAMFEILA
jgi:hypothetical protein